MANLRTSAKTRKVHMLQLRVAYILMTTQERALQLQNEEYCARPASPSKSTRKSVSQKHEARKRACSDPTKNYYRKKTAEYPYRK